MPTLRSLGLALLLGFAASAQAQPCTTSWTNAAGGAWATAANWDNGVPGAASHACITLDGTYTVTVVAFSVERLTLGGAAGAQTLAVSGNFSLGVAGRVEANGVLVWTANYLEGGALVNAGLVRLTGNTNSRGVRGTTALFRNEGTVEHADAGLFYVYNGARAENAAGWTFTGNGVIQGFSGAGTFANEAGATVRKTGGTLSRFHSGGLVVENAGTVDVQAGEIRFERPLNHQADGLFAGTGLLNVASASPFTFAGDTGPGSGGPGTLAWQQNYAPLASHTLHVELGGTAAGAFDRLNVAGAFQPRGTFQAALVDGFDPEIGDTFDVVSFASRTGDFDAYEGMMLPGRKMLVPSYVGNVLRLTVEQAPNDPPVANPIAFGTPRDTPLVVEAPGVLANDTDADGDPLTAVLESGPASGTLTLNADGSFTYTPNAGFTGDDAFTYRADDGLAQSNPATVTITVTAPANNPPVAGNVQATTPQDTPVDVDVLAAASDPDGDPLTITAVSTPASGTAEVVATDDGPRVRYTPEAGFSGEDTFTYTVSDGEDEATGTVTVTVTPTAPDNQPPVANADAYTTAQDTPLAVAAPGVLANDTDPDGDPLTAVLEAGPASGTLELAADGGFTYTPNAGFFGQDQFTYRASDGQLASAPATVSITVTEAEEPPDTAPPVCSGEVVGGAFAGTVTDAGSGVASVALAAGAVNLALAVADFAPGAPSVSFTASLVDATASGSGSVVGTDLAGNICSVPVALDATETTPPPPPDSTPPVCGAIVLERANGVLTAIVSSASDPESGIASVFFTTTRNMQGFTGSNAGSLSPYAQGATATFDPATTLSIALRAERINMSAGGAFVVRVTNGAGLTSNCDPVVSQLSATAPEAFGLEAPYPNPARAGDAVRLAFAVAEASEVRLAVYDLTGREVARLADGAMEPGRYEVAWTGADGASGALAAGVYVVRMEAGAFRQTLRVTVVR